MVIAMRIKCETRKEKKKETQKKLPLVGWLTRSHHQWIIYNCEAKWKPNKSKILRKEKSIFIPVDSGWSTQRKRENEKQ